jgi:hypothetical protein
MKAPNERVIAAAAGGHHVNLGIIKVPTNLRMRRKSKSGRGKPFFGYGVYPWMDVGIRAMAKARGYTHNSLLYHCLGLFAEESEKVLGLSISEAACLTSKEIQEAHRRAKLATEATHKQWSNAERC